MGLKRFREIFFQRTTAFAHPFYLSTSNLTSCLLCLRGLLDEQVTCLAWRVRRVCPCSCLPPSSAWPLQMPRQCLSDSRPKAVPRIGVQGALPLQLCFCAFSRKFVLSNLPYVASLDKNKEHAAQKTHSYSSPTGSLLLTFSKWL